MSALRDAFSEGTLEYWLCPREAFEQALVLRAGAVEEDLAEWRDAVEASGADAGRVRDRLGVNFVDPLEGDDWWPWLRWVGSRLAEVRADAGSLEVGLPRSTSYAWLRRGSSFSDESARRRAVDAVIGRCAALIRAWLDEGGPTTTRLRLVAEVGEDVGEALWFTEDPYEPDVAAAARSGTAAVVLRRSAAAGGYEVVGADVVDPQDGADHAALRAEFPALHAVLGGWFRGEDLEEDPEPWYLQRTMLETEDDAVLSAVAADGRRLLDSVDDLQLNRAVEALGCHVQPPHLRLWLTWMCWRIETFDWKPAA